MTSTEALGSDSGRATETEDVPLLVTFDECCALAGLVGTAPPPAVASSGEADLEERATRGLRSLVARGWLVGLDTEPRVASVPARLVRLAAAPGALAVGRSPVTRPAGAEGVEGTRIARLLPDGEGVVLEELVYDEVLAYRPMSSDGARAALLDRLLDGVTDGTDGLEGQWLPLGADGTIAAPEDWDDATIWTMAGPRGDGDDQMGLLTWLVRNGSLWRLDPDPDATGEPSRLRAEPFDAATLAATAAAWLSAVAVPPS